MTQDEIYKMAIDFINKSQPIGNPDLAAYWFQHGAVQVNKKAAAEIAELRAVNSEQADKIVDLQTRRREHLRTIADLTGEKAELVDLLESIRKADISQKINAGQFFLPQTIREEIQKILSK